MITTFAGEAWPCSGPSFPGDQIHEPDNMVRKVDSKPLEKGPRCLDGVGARRSGKGSTIGYA